MDNAFNPCVNTIKTAGLAYVVVINDLRYKEQKLVHTGLLVCWYDHWSADESAILGTQWRHVN